MNKKGNAGMGFVIGILVMIISLVFFMSLTPVIAKMFGIAKGRDSANCPGYIDSDSTALNNQTYDNTRNSDSVTCSILNFGPAMIILSVLFGLVAGIISGNLGKTDNPQPQYSSYSGGY